MADRKTPPQTAYFEHNVPVIERIAIAALAAWVAYYQIYLKLVSRADWTIGRIVFLAIWLLFIFGCVWWSCKPSIIITVGPDGVVVKEIRPWGARETRHAAADVSVPGIVESRGRRGLPYYECLLRLPDGRALTVCDDRSREVAEEARARLLAALGAGREGRQ